jgi:methylase of polypeptide subunit release factors
MPRDWEKIYRDKGDLGYEVLPRIKKASTLFKTKGYKKILDLGCGTGRHSLFLAEQGFEVYATDMSPTAVKIATEKASALNLHNIRFQQHDMRDIPFRLFRRGDMHLGVAPRKAGADSEDDR